MKQKILAIDDEALILDLVKIALETEGYDVITAERGSVGLEKAFSEKVDLILLDFMMPDISGFEACRRLKTNPATSNIPIIVLTGRVSEDDIRKIMDTGAVDYITKPFDPLGLGDKVKSILKKKA
jgi:DNA-binding response OmpR family regulator